MDFVNGWIGGVAGVLVRHPLDTLRTRQAVSGASLADTTRSLLGSGAGGSGGILARAGVLYQGVASPCISVGAWRAVVLGVQSQLLKRIAAARGEDAAGLPLPFVLGSASVAGVAGAVICSPFELVKTRAMLVDSGAMAASTSGAAGSSAGGPLAREMRVAVDLLKSPSLAVLRGFPLLALRDGYSMALFLGAHEAGKRFLVDNFGFSKASAAVASSLVAAPFGWVVCYPIEVVRINWIKGAEFKSYAGCCASLWRQQGVRGFFRGLPICCAMSALELPVTMGVFEVLRSS